MSWDLALVLSLVLCHHPHFLPSFSHPAPGLNYCLNADNAQIDICSPDHSFELHAPMHVCLFDISTWDSKGYLKLHKGKAELLISVLSPANLLFPQPSSTQACSFSDPQIQAISLIPLPSLHI